MRDRLDRLRFDPGYDVEGSRVGAVLAAVRGHSCEWPSLQQFGATRANAPCEWPLESFSVLKFRDVVSRCESPIESEVKPRQNNHPKVKATAGGYPQFSFTGPEVICHTMSYHVIPRHTISYHVILARVTLCTSQTKTRSFGDFFGTA